MKKTIIITIISILSLSMAYGEDTSTPDSVDNNKSRYLNLFMVLGYGGENLLSGPLLPKLMLQGNHIFGEDYYSQIELNYGASASLWVVFLSFGAISLENGVKYTFITLDHSISYGYIFLENRPTFNKITYNPKIGFRFGSKVKWGIRFGPSFKLWDNSNENFLEIPIVSFWAKKISFNIEFYRTLQE